MLNNHNRFNEVEKNCDEYARIVDEVIVELVLELKAKSTWKFEVLKIS